MFGMRHSYGCAPGGWGARRGWRGHFGERWGGRHGMGGNMMRAGRMLAQGDLRLIALALIAEQPRHGYEIIKVLEEKTSGWYSPSPGIVYPTLTYLEEAGYVTAAAAMTTTAAGCRRSCARHSRTCARSRPSVSTTTPRPKRRWSRCWRA